MQCISGYDLSGAVSINLQQEYQNFFTARTEKQAGIELVLAIIRYNNNLANQFLMQIIFI